MFLRTLLIGLFASFLALIISLRVVNKYNQNLEKSSRLDHLTQISNRLELDHRLQTEFSLCQRTGETMSLLMIDLDNFKKINDNFGHFSGDDTLIQFTKLVSSSIRKTDSFGRWGGDEFLVILPKTNGPEGVCTANQLRSKVAASDIFLKYSLTISIGVATRTKIDTMESLLSRTDKALYMAKGAGKDQIFFQE